MRKPSRTFSALITFALLCSTVSIHAQETGDSVSANAQEIGHSDLEGTLARARSQLPNDLEAGSVQTYLDGIAAYGCVAKFQKATGRLMIDLF